MSRLLLVCVMALAIAATAACPAKDGKKDGDGQSGPKPAADFPTGYTTWKKANAETIVREEEKIAREVYAKATDGLGAGTVLVKEQYSYENGTKGRLKLIAVMRRGADRAKNKGWEFAVYDPATKTAGDNTACLGCHSLQEDNDFLFGDRTTYGP